MTGKELEERREALGLSRPQLAEKLGCDVGKIDVWENSEIAASEFPTLLELAMDHVEYLMTRMSDEEFDAVIARADEAIARADKIVSR